MESSPTPFERVFAYFSGDAAVDLAVRALRSYYTVRADTPHWTGSVFDRLASTPPSDAFTATDMLAVSMLSVSVPPRAAIWLVEGRTANDLLAEIPNEASLWDHPELLDRDSWAWRLSELVDNRYGIGETIASKILAAKRPALLPVHDQHVDAALHFGKRRWAFFQKIARDDGARDLLAKIDEAKTSAGVPAYVATLRIIDVVVWMRQRGWVTHDDETCTVGCDFRGFEST